MHLNPLDWGISRILARDGIRERESVEALCQFVQPDMTIFDLGANIGFYVLIEAQIISKGSGKIIAIEPGPDNYQLLKLNITENNYSDCVTVYHGAVTNKSGMTSLRLSNASNCHKLEEISSNNADGKFIAVPAFTFSDILTEGNISIDQLDFLRMDIEGAEYLILPHIIELIANKEKFLMFIEFHPGESNLQKHKMIMKSLESMGYNCLKVTKEYVDGNIIRRKHCPNTTIYDLYSDEFFLQQGGCEVFLGKG
jgi:FkbM family methyltransferase